MARPRSSPSHSHSMLAFVLLVAFVFTPTRADLPDPCGGSSTMAISHVGDMAILVDTEDVTRERRAAVADERRLWPEGKVYYTIDPAFSDEEERLILEGMKHWEDYTCVRFYPRRNEEHYLHFLAGSIGCCSYVGMARQGKQPISLVPSSCTHFSVIVHEIGHAIGFYHEQSRPDRDDYVNIIEENVHPAFQDNFEKLKLDQVAPLEFGYDYNSIMHYDPHFFSTNGKDTIVVHDPNIELGQAEELSPLDIMETNLLYKCTEPHPPPSIILPDQPTTPTESPTTPYSCGTVFDGQLNGTITSPGYPTYSHNQDCGWVIRVPPGFLLNLSFQALSVETSKDCSRDYVDVYASLDSSGSRLGHLCGTYSKAEYLTYGSEFFIRYHTDGANTGLDASFAKGFRAHFSVTDVDECAQGYGAYCSHSCLNTFGSWTCTCKDGYYLSADGYTCFDHNECAIDNGGCDHECANYGGRYECSCKDGYVLQQDEKTCLNEKDANECATENGGCSHTCTNTLGSFECSCPKGYVLGDDRLTCVDVNECSTSNGGCSDICTNTQGSFKCSCAQGYSLRQDELTCTDVNECSIKNGGCSHSCSNTDGSYECGCPEGYLLKTDKHKCTDINECSTNNGGCNHTCINTQGSFKCDCPEGYTLGADKLTCDDIDECQSGFDCSGHGDCMNYQGTYFCMCHPGYLATTNSKDCKDKNECLVENGGCSHECSNTDGSYLCSCPAGLKLGTDYKTCTDIDECATNNGGCSHNCIDTKGSFECSCPQGYSLEDGHTCVDINECLTNNGGCCGICTNNIGSFECGCQEGYTVGEDGCNCVDIDECADFDCSGHGTCFNSQGTYYCFCSSGYSPTAQWKDCI